MHTSRSNHVAQAIQLFSPNSKPARTDVTFFGRLHLVEPVTYPAAHAFLSFFQCVLQSEMSDSLLPVNIDTPPKLRYLETETDALIGSWM